VFFVFLSLARILTRVSRNVRVRFGNHTHELFIVSITTILITAHLSPEPHGYLLRHHIRMSVRK
jgi:hypothetical protein